MSARHQHQPIPEKAWNVRFELDVQKISAGWSFEERQNGRRLVKVKHSLEMNAEQPEIIVRLEPILRPNIQAFDTVISCIFWEERSYWVFTSVDAILVLEALLESPLAQDDRNRVRRNLEGFRPVTLSKSADTFAFFKKIMSYSEPRPRNIEKDLKVFRWETLAPMAIKIVHKYSLIPHYSRAFCNLPASSFVPAPAPTPLSPLSMESTFNSPNSDDVYEPDLIPFSSDLSDAENSRNSFFPDFSSPPIFQPEASSLGFDADKNWDFSWPSRDIFASASEELFGSTDLFPPIYKFHESPSNNYISASDSGEVSCESLEGFLDRGADSAIVLDNQNITLFQDGLWLSGFPMDV